MQDITQTNADFTAECRSAQTSGESAAVMRQQEGRDCLDTMNGTMSTFMCSPGSPDG